MGLTLEYVKNSSFEKEKPFLKGFVILGSKQEVSTVGSLGKNGRKK